jgi:hypothetical protein
MLRLRHLIPQPHEQKIQTADSAEEAAREIHASDLAKIAAAGTQPSHSDTPPKSRRTIGPRHIHTLRPSRIRRKPPAKSGGVGQQTTTAQPSTAPGAIGAGGDRRAANVAPHGSQQKSSVPWARVAIYLSVAIVVSLLAFRTLSLSDAPEVPDSEITLAVLEVTVPSDLHLDLQPYDVLDTDDPGSVELTIWGEQPKNARPVLIASSDLGDRLAHCEGLAKLQPRDPLLENSWISSQVERGMTVYDVDLAPKTRGLGFGRGVKNYLFECGLDSSVVAASHGAYYYFYTPELAIVSSSLSNSLNRRSELCSRAVSPSDMPALRLVSMDPPYSEMRTLADNSRSLVWTSCHVDRFRVGRRYFSANTVSRIRVAYTSDAAERLIQRRDVILGALLGVAGSFVASSLDIVISSRRTRRISGTSRLLP